MPKISTQLKMVLKQYKLSSFGDTKRLLSINDALRDLISFREKLYVFNENGKRVGRFSAKIDSKEIQKSKKMVVHISSSGILKGHKSETIVTGILTQNLKTLEEIRYEASQMKIGVQERRFYLLRERTNYYYSVTESFSDMENKREGTIPFTKTLGLIGEAANLALMRTIAIRGYQGILSLKTILPNGKRCHNYYISKSGQRTVNGVKMDIIIIYRSVTDHDKYSVTSTCALTKAGQLIYLFWSNSNYFLHVDPDLEVYGNMVDEYKEVGLHRHWNRDKQVFSYYLDEKVAMEASIRSYRHENQEVKRVMADWLQHVLNLKPPDILCSAIEYFTAFGDNTLKTCLSKLETENVYTH